jgi:hypothetical protein
MTEVRIRDVDGWVVEFHRRLAKLEGRSLEGELRQILTDAALRRSGKLRPNCRLIDKQVVGYLIRRITSYIHQSRSWIARRVEPR